MELSVIIVSYNVSDYLKQSLYSVKKASENIDCEIFVVDNNSSDDSCHIVKTEFPDVILIKNKINIGFSAANNKAIKLAKGRYILLLNPDTFINEDSLLKCIIFMESHPDAGATGVRMVDGEGRYLPESKRGLPTPATAFYKIFGISKIFPGTKLFNRYHFTHIDSFETSRTEIISGAYMFLRSEALSKTGLLDEDFFIYGEDIDLSYRLLKAGYNNYYFPEVQITHFKGKSTPRDKFTDIFHFYNAMIIYVRKRAKEGNMTYLQYLLIPAIYFRQGISLFIRILRIISSYILRKQD